MINLIPPEGKRAVVREYWIRIVSVWAFLLSGIGVVAVLSLIPAYALVNVQLETLEGEVEKGGETEDRYLTAEKAVHRANALIEQLGKELSPQTFSHVIAEADAAAGGEIQLRRLEIAREGRMIKKFQIQGTATTREALANFKTELERSPLFSTVALPLSDLALDMNLPFAITVTLSNQ